MNGQKRKRIVILSGGFGGIYTAHYLEKALRNRDDFEITLINKENYFVFQPMLAEVVSGSIGMLDTVSPIRRMLPRTDLHVRDVESIDIENQTITTTPGFRPQPNLIHYRSSGAGARQRHRLSRTARTTGARDSFQKPQRCAQHP